LLVFPGRDGGIKIDKNDKNVIMVTVIMIVNFGKDREGGLR